MQLIIILLISLFIYQDEPIIITCDIVFANDKSRIIKCTKDEVVIFSLDEWPKEWSDSTKVNDKVKISVSNKEILPIQSCGVRTKLKHEEIRRNRKSEFKLPLQLPIDKDCQ